MTNKDKNNFFFKEKTELSIILCIPEDDDDVGLVSFPFQRANRPPGGTGRLLLNDDG